jgi:hypothetical protein
MFVEEDLAQSVLLVERDKNQCNRLLFLAKLGFLRYDSGHSFVINDRKR